MSTDLRELVIPAGHARLWRMRAGERVTIAQTEGHQVGDFILWPATKAAEMLIPEGVQDAVGRAIEGFLLGISKLSDLTVDQAEVC